MNSRRLKERGVVLVETAIVLPVIVLILVGMLEFGIALHDYLILQNASREAARFGAVGNTKSAIEQRVRDFTFQLDDKKLGITVTNAQGSRGTALTVRTTYPVPVITGMIKAIVGSNDFALQAESVMRLE